MPSFLAEPQRWVIPVLFLVALVGTPLALWWEQRKPSSCTRRPELLAQWRSLPTVEQRAHDTAALGAAQAVETDA